jgi:tripartite-type tricarboxylate transporter receptor subunit TctC
MRDGYSVFKRVDIGSRKETRQLYNLKLRSNSIGTEKTPTWSPHAVEFWQRSETQRSFARARRGDFMLIWRALIVVLSLLLAPVASMAQDFPNKPIRLIVPFPPGGPNDIIARVIGQRMSELVKQPVVIDNRAGQGGVLGTDAVAKAAPDGYTIGISSAGALAISPSMEKVSYDTLKDLQPVTLVATVPEMLVVAADVPAGDLKELIALAKAQPGKLNFASSGPGSLPHLAGELLKLTAKIDIVHVPYRGAAPAVNDLLGQQVQMVFLDLPVILPQVQAGRLKPIAIGSPERAPTAKDVPTTAEAGLPNLRIENWYGMVAPAQTPPAIVAALNRIATAAMRDAIVKDKLASQGLTLAGDTPEQFRRLIEAEIKKWADVIKEAGIATEK